jgi:protein tyrosine phosphatase
MGVEVVMPEKTCKVKANKINLGKYTYLASPEPPKEAGNLFWTMIAQQDSPLIVKLKTTTNEDQIYWPEAGHDLDYEFCTVKLAKEEELSPHLMKRTFHIEKEGGMQIVQQLDFSNWPDGETPDISSLMELMYHVDKMNIPSEKPITVHCRAGIGRTGTFMAIHNAIKDPGEKIANLVHSMRIQRPGRPMVENEKQYAYIHEVCDFYKKAENKQKCT